MLATYPDEGLQHHYRLTDAMVDLGGTSDDADPERGVCVLRTKIGDASGMWRSLQMLSLGSYAQRRGQFTAGLGRVADRATGPGHRARAPGPRRRGVAGSACAPCFVDGPVPVPEALDRCQSFLDLVDEDRAARVTVLLTIGRLEARDGVIDHWRRHSMRQRRSSTISGYARLLVHSSPIRARLPKPSWPPVIPVRVVDLLKWSCSALARIGDLGHLAGNAPLTAQALLEVGRLEEVEHYALWGRDVAAADDLDAQARWRIAMSGLRSRQARHGEAIALARESLALLAGSEFVVLLTDAHMALAGALRRADDERGAIAAALEAQRLATAKQDRSALRKIDVFLTAAG